MKKNKEVNIRIKEISEIAFNLMPITVPIEQLRIGENLNIALGFRFEVEAKNEIFKFFTLIQYSINEIIDPVVSLESEIVFEIQNLQSILNFENKNHLQIDNNFLATLAGVAIGTTRGVLAANLKGNPMAKFPLPILNPSEVLKNLSAEQPMESK